MKRVFLPDLEVSEWSVAGLWSLVCWASTDSNPALNRGQTGAFCEGRTWGADGLGRWRGDKCSRALGCYCLAHKLQPPDCFPPWRGSRIKREHGGVGGGGAREGLVQPFRPDRPSLLPTPAPLTQNLPADPERAEKGRALGQEQEPAVARGSPGHFLGDSLMRTDWGSEENAGRPGFRPPC